MERERESVSTSHRITKKMILFGVIPFVVLGTDDNDPCCVS